MSSNEASRTPPPVLGPWARLQLSVRTLLRTRLTTGLLTILPIIITFWLVRVLFIWLRDASMWVVEAYLLSPWGRTTLESWRVSPEQLRTLGVGALPGPIGWAVSILSVLLTFILLYLCGLFMALYVGRRVLAAIEHLFDRVPIVKSIYRLLKQVAELFTSDQRQQFQRVALVKFPNSETRVVSFITNSLRDPNTGAELITVFMPTTPNPTTGFLFCLPRNEAIEVDWTVEEAFKMIISGGIVLPSRFTISPPQQPPAVGALPR